MYMKESGTSFMCRDDFPEINDKCCELSWSEINNEIADKRIPQILKVTTNGVLLKKCIDQIPKTTIY